MIGWGAHFFCKMPGDGKIVAWHKDASSWTLTPSKALTVWLANDDADVANGCMKFVAGSHLQGPLTCRRSAAEEDTVLDQTVENAEEYGEFVSNELRADAPLLHAGRPRHAGLKQGIVVSGRDPDNHSGNPPRPAQDYDGIRRERARADAAAAGRLSPALAG